MCIIWRVERLRRAKRERLHWAQPLLCSFTINKPLVTSSTFLLIQSQLLFLRLFSLSTNSTGLLWGLGVGWWDWRTRIAVIAYVYIHLTCRPVLSSLSLFSLSLSLSLFLLAGKTIKKKDKKTREIDWNFSSNNRLFLWFHLMMCHCGGWITTTLF